MNNFNKTILASILIAAGLISQVACAQTAPSAPCPEPFIDTGVSCLTPGSAVATASGSSVILGSNLAGDTPVNAGAAVTIGNNLTYGGQMSTVVGNNAQGSDFSTVYGAGAVSTTIGLASGVLSYNSGFYGTAQGNSANVHADFGAAVGAFATVQAAAYQAAAIGAMSVATRPYEFSIGSAFTPPGSWLTLPTSRMLASERTESI